MIKNLPNWCITDDNPTFYDTESATTIEMVAKLYAKMQELISDYSFNNTQLTNIVDDFKKIITDNFNVFSVELRQEFQDFIDVTELKVKDQDIKVNDAIEYMKINLVENCSKIINEKITSGDIHVGIQYKPIDEELVIIMDGGV